MHDGSDHWCSGVQRRTRHSRKETWASTGQPTRSRRKRREARGTGHNRIKALDAGWTSRDSQEVF